MKRVESLRVDIAVLSLVMIALWLLGSIGSFAAEGTAIDTEAAGPNGQDTVKDDGTNPAFFSASPMDISDILYISPLGALNPPSHVFPTDHIYFYIARNSSGGSNIVPFHAPGDMIVTAVAASQHLVAGFTDFALDLTPCEGVTVVFGHVSSLRKEIFGDTTSFQGWDLLQQYSTGGETYRLWRKRVSIKVESGQELGTVGGNPGQWALDFGVYDDRVQAAGVANPARWLKSRYLHAVCPFDYYETGLLRNQLLNLIDRDVLPADAHRCGTVFQDVPGTAQGCWFLSGINKTYPEDPHLALVYSNTSPVKAVLSVGTSIASLPSKRYAFAPRSTGLLNRPFSDITPDGRVYGYQVEGFGGIIIVSMPDVETLWIETLPGGNSNPFHWTFTNNKKVFVR